DSLAFRNINLGVRNDVFRGKQQIFATNDGGLICIISSWTNSGNTNPDSTAVQSVIKLDSSLNTVWHYKHPVTPGRDLLFKAITELPDSSILVLSSSYGTFINNQFELLQFSAQGQLMHTYPFTSSISQQVSLQEGTYLGDSIVYVAGRSRLPKTTTFYNDSYKAKISFKNQAVGVANALPEPVVAVYPNPVSNTVSITLPEHVLQAELQLISSSGQEVLTRKLKAASTEADLSQLPPGLYFYRIFTENGVKTGKLVKE
ncbi:MAG: T9SS type A sorting domain-containing protein, partial [Hymenobacteraceae bacterium]|nr:T9SS type A sorting domain-containing protein [Hymenobacteraceae bacterium]MDX5395128.1 T9SS type A sorting domain-containing protein [Hymenobacteraceae bacterium]MDX5511169.1 T9SS type A sorting domain-containing protein [Hymenobacteraceae bacterium]